MRLSFKDKKTRLVAASAAGLVLLGAFAFFGGSDDKSEKQLNTEAAAEVRAETGAVKTTDAVKIYQFADYKKASISEYDMSEKSGVSKTEKTAKTKENDNEFTVKFPSNSDKPLNAKYPPMNYTATRSIAGEYYTVNDQISGKRVTLNGHELICQLVNSEIGDAWGEEAIKAQAVAAYSYVRFCDNAGYLPSIGLKSGYSAKLERCVTAVEGQVVCYNGVIIDAVYSASTAGYSTSSKDIWGAYHPYLQCVKSAYDNEDPHWGADKTYTADQVRSRVSKTLGITLSDNVKNWFKVENCFSGKYIGKITIDGQKTITGVELCNMMDVISNAMDISYKDGKFTFTSYGWGHGVGMSQWGACLYARRGWTYDQILRHYYTDTTVELSSVNQKALERANMSQEELDKEAESAATDDKNSGSNSAVEVAADAKEKESGEKKDTDVSDNSGSSSKAEKNKSSEQTSKSEDKVQNDEKSKTEESKTAADTADSSSQTEEESFENSEQDTQEQSEFTESEENQTEDLEE